MVARNYGTVNPPTSQPDIARINNRVERRRPKPKIQPRSPESLQKLINHYNGTTVKRNYSDDTKDNIQKIINMFSGFCAGLPKNPPWRSIIRDCSKGTSITFFIHICEVCRVKKRSAVHQYYLQLKMLFNRENGRHMDTNDAKEVLAYIYGPLTKRFNLDITVAEKPVCGIDELLLLLTCHWARDTSTYSTERQRVQYPLILLILFTTGCRPAELVDAKTKKSKKQRWPGLENDDDSAGQVTDGGSEDAENNAGADLGFEDDGDRYDNDIIMSDVGVQPRKFKALCYEDVRLLVVRNPIVGERDVFAMEVKLSYHKGADRKPKPTIFFFTEVDNPMLCPITHLVALAVVDKAFEAPSLITVERVFEQKVSGPVMCTPLTWKQEILKTPIFRQDGGAVDGVLPSPMLALTYSQYGNRLKLLGLLIGLLATLTSRCFRRNTGNVVDHKATSAVRDQIMRHNPNSAVYNAAYINERVLFDVQSAVLERPSADGILRMLTHMSLMRDPRAPVHVPDDVFVAFPPDPRIVDLEEQRVKLKAGAYRIQGTEVEAEVRRITSEIGIARTRRRNIISQEFRADYFRRRPIQDIERQNSGQQEEEYTEPAVEHQIPERTQLSEFICNHVTSITSQEIIARRVHFARLMLALCRRREVPRRYRLRVAQPEPRLVKEESPLPGLEPFPIKLAKDQCPICIGDESKSYKERMGSFCRPAKMMDHVERIHLQGRDPLAKIECYHPMCKSQGLVLEHLDHFKNHVQTVHDVKLRELRFVRSSK